MEKAVLKAYAKLNLALDITGRRGDGYHFMRMVMQAVALHDLVAVERAGTADIFIACDDPDVPCDERNFCHKAARHFFAAAGFPAHGVRITIQKRIPMEAGLAGGSTDAAAVLVGLNRLFGAGLSAAELCEIGVKAGADVPFCIVGGTALCEGIGEEITPLAPLPNCTIVIAKPFESMKTAGSFARYDRAVIRRRPDIEAMLAAVGAHSLQGVAENLCNVLEEVTALESVRDIRAALLHGGALGAEMTGSGTAVFGIFEEPEAAWRCAARLKAGCKAVFITAPVPNGAEVIE